MSYKPSYLNFGKRALVVGGLVNRFYKHNGVHVINKTGSSIAQDKLVAILGYDTTSRLPKIVLADADAASTHKQIYVTLASIADGSEGYVFEGGLSAATLDTSGVSAAGDPVYLDTTAGAFTATAPTATNAVVFPVGWAYVKSASVGQIHWHIGRHEKIGLNELQTAAGGVNSETTSTRTVTKANDSGRTIVYNRAAGGTVTLPASTGGGDKYRVVVGTLLTSATLIIKVANSTDVFTGGVLINDIGDTSAATADFWPTAATSDTMTMTQSLGGGKIGDFFEVEDIAAGFWAVRGVLQGMTDPATPFSATV
jgi:hypothetical protein